MAKFWNWMIAKKYGDRYHLLYEPNKKFYFEPTKQMLRGYKIEYLSELFGYRGLWRSFMVKDNGELSEGWSVTFEWKTKIVETDYKANADEALDSAINIVSKLEL